MPHPDPTAPALSLDETRARAIFAMVCDANGDHAVEVTLAATVSELTRFANNTIHQNVAEEHVSLSVRTQTADGRTARATTNRLDPEGVRAVVARAGELTRLQHPDPEALPMAGPQTIVPVTRFFPATAALSPADRAAVVGDIVSEADRHGFTTAGVVANQQGALAILNSNGLEAFHRETSAEYSITMLAIDSSGWAKGNAPDLSRLAPVAAARRAAEKARLSAAPVEIPPGRYTVILEPAAVLDLMGFLFYDFGGLSVLDQRSFLTGRTGTKLFGDNITIRDDVAHPLQSGAPFDGEGIPRQATTLVEAGTVRHLVYARQTAVRMQREQPAMQAAPTGHGFPLPNEYGEAPANIVMQGGTNSLDAMIADTERGILVTRLWYIREVDPFKKILTGMTRDGTFLIEDGKLQRGVRNFRFNQSMVEMLNQVDQLGVSERSSGEESFDMVVPPMRVHGFQFTEVTRF